MKNILRQNINTLICCIVTLILAAFTIYAVLKGSGISLNELIADLRDQTHSGKLSCNIINIPAFNSMTRLHPPNAGIILNRNIRIKMSLL